MSEKKVLETRSRDEIDRAFHELSEGDLSRLRKIAGYYAWPRRLDAEELVQEALRRVLDGGRVWPNTIDFVRFLAGVMKSVSHGEIKRRMEQPVLVALVNHGAAEQGVDPPDSVPNAEECLIAEGELAEMKKAVLDLFNDDPVAQVIVEGTMENLPAEELQNLTGLDPTAYASKRRLIRRRIDKKFFRGVRS
ncbi:MAG: sigma-70 RNA polymerase sigma factor region 4 domain-containing protein [Burkholderiales bacterium]